MNLYPYSVIVSHGDMCKNTFAWYLRDNTHHSDGTLFMVKGQILWSYDPGNTLLTWSVKLLAAVNKMSVINN